MKDAEMKHENLTELSARQAQEQEERHARWGCACEVTELRRRAIRGGGVQFRRQCIQCGEPAGNSVAHSQIEDPAAVPAWDDQLKDARLAAREQARLDMNKRHAAERSEAYGGYLASPEWRARRAKVMRRASGQCEGCADAPATEVHHLTYERWGREMLFDLVALCGSCHDAIHSPEDQL